MDQKVKMTLLSKMFKFVMFTSMKYKIDDSHGITHSMNVLHNAHNIYESELAENPELSKMQKIIYVSSILHDMCDKKYMVESDGIYNIQQFLEDKMTDNEINSVKEIITTMSYSKVKVNGFPDLGDLQHAYHIVREADLLAAYDFDRCMIYKMYTNGSNVEDAFKDASELFKKRVFQHDNDKLLITDYSRNLHYKLQADAVQRISVWNKLLKTPSMNRL